MAALDLDLPDLDATIRLGAALARHLRVGDVIALHGDLGAGKTELARAIIRTATGDPALIVPSPTFTLAETYDTAPGAIWHFDLYRLGAPEEALELGLEEALTDGILLVEWPERLARLLPVDRLDVRLAYGAAPDRRRVRLEGGSAWSARLAMLEATLAGAEQRGLILRRARDEAAKGEPTC